MPPSVTTSAGSSFPSAPARAALASSSWRAAHSESASLALLGRARLHGNGRCSLPAADERARDTTDRCTARRRTVEVLGLLVELARTHARAGNCLGVGARVICSDRTQSSCQAGDQAYAWRVCSAAATFSVACRCMSGVLLRAARAGAAWHLVRSIGSAATQSQGLQARGAAVGCCTNVAHAGTEAAAASITAATAGGAHIS